jgi:hypothetical protein
MVLLQVFLSDVGLGNEFRLWRPLGDGVARLAGRICDLRFATCDFEGSLGLFRQKMIVVAGENGVWEALEWFLMAGGGFVWFLRDAARWRRVVGVLRDWRREDLKT